MLKLHHEAGDHRPYSVRRKGLGEPTMKVKRPGARVRDFEGVEGTVVIPPQPPQVRR
jgi:hypothetical protein